MKTGFLNIFGFVGVGLLAALASLMVVAFVGPLLFQQETLSPISNFSLAAMAITEEVIKLAFVWLLLIPPESRSGKGNIPLSDPSSKFEPKSENEKKLIPLTLSRKDLFWKITLFGLGFWLFELIELFFLFGYGAGFSQPDALAAKTEIVFETLPTLVIHLVSAFLIFESGLNIKKKRLLISFLFLLLAIFVHLCYNLNISMM